MIALRPGRWAFAYNRRGIDAEHFSSNYFSAGKRVLIIAAGGFDPRATIVPEMLKNRGDAQFELILLREERPGAAVPLYERAEAAISKLQALFPQNRVIQCQIFSDDGALVAGYTIRTAVQDIDFDQYDDVVLDVSAMSLGASFPLAKILYQHADAHRIKNLHVFIATEPSLDAHVRASISDRVHSPLGFARSAYSSEPAAKLWIPQLRRGLTATMERIYTEISPDEVCPILPFPSSNIREPEDLIIEYGDLLGEDAWQVDARSIIYAAEDDPLDVYRTIVRITTERRDVFSALGDSEVILTPMGSKVLALGTLLSALELDLSVRYVETESYEVEKDFPESVKCEIISIWLHGGPIWMPKEAQSE